MVMYELPRRADSGVREALTALAEQQAGVVRRDQLARSGLSRHQVDAMIVASRWRAQGVIAIAMHNGPVTHLQKLWLAVLNAGGEAGLAARTAATEQGLTGWEPDRIEIVVPRGTCVPAGLSFAVKVHESRRFTAADLHPGRQLPQVTVERAVIDAAAWSPRPRVACGLLAAAVQQRVTTVRRLYVELDKAGKVTYRRLMAAVLADIDGGAQSMSEVDFLRFCRRHHLPAPVLQAARLDGAGRRRYLDATFRRSDGRLVRVEIDGALHLVVRTYWDDMSRGNDLVIGGENTLRFPSYVVRADDEAAIDQLRRALGVSGPARVLAS